MPVTYRAGGASSERLFLTLMDWARRVMQLAGVATVVLYAYILYGLFNGGVGQWGTLDAPARAHILKNVQGAILYLDVALGLLLISLCVLYYDEEPFGYSLVAVSLFLYYGLPFALEQLMPGKTAEWASTRNVAALAILAQIRLAALMLAVPGGILLVRDIFLRFVDGARRNKEDFGAMQYGGAVKEEAPVGSAPIGMFAKCWQLPFCRDAIRKRCPIYHARSRCWKERVGCMCEENVIRNAMDALINKEMISFERPAEAEPAEPPEPAIAGFTIESAASKPEPAEKTAELPRREPLATVSRKNVKIPYNTTLSAAVKRERCRNCVIYNEHQRLKYQFFAPLAVLGVPGLAYWKIDALAGTLKGVLHAADTLMSRVSLDPNARNTGVISSITSTSVIAEYLIIGCMVVILTTVVLRGLEYCVFKLKI